VQKSQTFAAALGLVLAALAATSWWSDEHFLDRAARATGTLIALDEVRVRWLFSTEIELHPVISFVDAAGVPRQFTVQAAAPRVGVAPDTPLGSPLGALVLYDPTDPTRAQLEVERRGRGALILLLAAAGLLLTPRLLAWAFQDRRTRRSLEAPAALKPPRDAQTAGSRAAVPQPPRAPAG
jgi:hypothetical protein